MTTQSRLSEAQRITLVSDLACAVLNGRGLEALLPRIAPHHALVVPLPLFRPEPGPRGVRTLAVLVARALSGVEIDVGPLVVEGQKVGGRFELAGNHTGSFGIERPTGKAIRLSGLLLCRFDPDATDLVETRAVVSLLHLFEQLGVVRVRDVVASTYA